MSVACNIKFRPSSYIMVTVVERNERSSQDFLVLRLAEITK